MRVISGQARGHKLKTPEGLDTRPTTDRIKESLFNILAPSLPKCTFLDLFAGSGGIGIEALSRGGSKAVFVDASAVCKEIIEDNLRHTKLYDRAEIIKKDVVQAIKVLGAENRRFDIIFLDPPYEGGYIEPTLQTIAAENILNKEGFIVVERSTDIPIENTYGFHIFREKNYKNTTMTFLSLED